MRVMLTEKMIATSVWVGEGERAQNRVWVESLCE